MQRVVHFLLIFCVLALVACGESSNEPAEDVPAEAANAADGADKGELADDAYARFGDADGDVCQASVIEVFSYTCVHCYRFEPHLERWLEDAEQRNIDFERMAMPGGQAMNTWARVFKSLQLMDELDRVHAPLFERLHGDEQQIESLDDLLAFIESHDIDTEAFNEMLQSDEVTESLREDVNLMQEAEAIYTPSIIVNRRYKLEPRGENAFEDMLKATDHLIERDRREAGC